MKYIIACNKSKGNRFKFIKGLVVEFKEYITHLKLKNKVFTGQRNRKNKNKKIKKN